MERIAHVGAGIPGRMARNVGIVLP